MAGQYCHVTSGEVALVAATPKSVLQIKAAANQRDLVKALRFMGKQPAGGTDTPIKIRMTRSSANFGTFTAATPAKNNPSNGETVQTSAGSNATVEPTSPTDGGYWIELPPQIYFAEGFSLDTFMEIPGGQSIQFEATSPGTPTLTITASFEE